MARVQLRQPGQPARAGSISARPKVRVYTKTAWTGAWAPEHYLRPLQATVAAAPNKSVAAFEWLIGRLKYSDTNIFKPFPARDLRDYYVMVERLGASGGSNSALWVGRIAEGDLDYHGVSDNGTGPVARGRRVFTAYGLEHELDRAPVRDSLVAHSDGKGFFVDTPLVFNDRFDGHSGLNQLGNRSPNLVTNPEDGSRQAHGFAGAKGQTHPWTVGDIVRYLLAFYSPRGIRFTLAGNYKALDDLVLPRVDVSGLTVFGALNHLIDRRRGLGWCLRVDTAGTAAVHVYSVFDQAVRFEDATIQPNTEQVRLELDGLGHLVDEQDVRVDTLARYGKVIVAGKRVLSCFSLNMATDETLEKGWTNAEETEYRNASGSDTELARNRAARAVDKLAHVYRHFHVPKAFRWQTGNGGGQSGPAGKVNANPLVGADGRIKVGDSPQSAIRDWGHRLERHLPFVKEQAKSDSEPEYLEPFALVYDETNQRYVNVENADPGKGTSGSVRMLDTAFGVEVKFTPNHVLAKGQFDQNAMVEGVATPAKKDSVAAAYDFGKMICTVAARLDARLRVIADINTAGKDRDRVLFIEVPDAELHYVAPGTVTGVNPQGVLQFSTAEQAIRRDDSERLRRIAAMAKAWYGVERGALRVTARDLWQQYPVGCLVLSVTSARGLGQRPVNTPVTQVTYDLVNMKTAVRTNWAELDVTVGRARRRTA